MQRRVPAALFLVVLLVGACAATTAAMPLMGGFGVEKPADSEVNELLALVKDQAAGLASKAFTLWKPVSYKTQVVAGTNFLVKVETNPGEFAHVKIFRPLPFTNELPQVTSFEEDKSAAEAL